MKTIRVVAAVIFDRHENGETVFSTARGYGDYRGLWEFPGGKIEPGETPEDALIREIREELETEIRVEDKLITVEQDYPAFHLSMDCFRCRILSGQPVLKEAEAARWLTADEMDTVEWLPADREVAGLLKKILTEKDGNDMPEANG